MVEVGMAHDQVVDAHDLLAPKIARDHALAEVKAAGPCAARVYQHYARVRKAHHCGVALAYREKSDAHAALEPSIVRPPSRVRAQHNAKCKDARATPSNRQLRRGRQLRRRGYRTALDWRR